MNRTGKIARLPRSIRDELNLRLDRNLPGPELVEWLNSLPEVQQTLHSHFGSKPINPQNLSQWRLGGFAEWRAHRDFLDGLHDSSRDVASLDAAAPDMADAAARVISARIFLTLTKWNGDPQAPRFALLKHLTGLVRTLALLRRGDHSAAKIKMEQRAFDLACQNRETLKPCSTTPRPVTSPAVQRWTRHFGLPELDPTPPPDPEYLELLEAIRSITHGTPLPTDPSEPPLPPVPSNQIKAPQSTPQTPPSDHPAGNRESANRESEIGADSRFPTVPISAIPSPSSHPTDPSPIHDSPIHDSTSPTSLDPAPSIVTTATVTIPPNVSPSPPPPPTLTPPVPTPTHPPSEAAREAGVTDAELWEMRYRDLPGDTPPAWRLTLPIKTIPPWQQHSYLPPDPPPHPVRSLVGYR